MTETQTAQAAHDHHLLDLFRLEAKAEQIVGWKLSSIQYATLGNSSRYNDRRTVAEMVADMQALVDAGDTRIIRYSGQRPSQFLAEYNDALAGLHAVGASIAAHEAAYTGWQRFFLVTSSAGLVHASTWCHTCNKGRKLTRFALVAEFSGQPVADLVEAVGPMLCSVCFPAAPTEWQEQDRVPARIAQVLFDLGYDAFKTELAKYQAKRAAKAAR